MTKILLSALFMIASAGSAFAGQAEISSVTELRDTALAELGFFDESDCKISLNQLAGGMSLVMERQSDSAELLVREGDLVQFRSELGERGDYLRTFVVNGQDQFKILHADDSYVSLELQAGGRTVKCEADF